MSESNAPVRTSGAFSLVTQSVTPTSYRVIHIIDTDGNYVDVWESRSQRPLNALQERFKNGLPPVEFGYLQLEVSYDSGASWKSVKDPKALFGF